MKWKRLNVLAFSRDCKFCILRVFSKIVPPALSTKLMAKSHEISFLNIMNNYVVSFCERQ